jgi:hypothetical protein
MWKLLLAASLACSLADAARMRIENPESGQRVVAIVGVPHEAESMIDAKTTAAAAAERLLCNIDNSLVELCLAEGVDECVLPPGACATAGEIAAQGDLAPLALRELAARPGAGLPAGLRRAARRAAVAAAAAVETQLFAAAGASNVTETETATNITITSPEMTATATAFAGLTAAAACDALMHDHPDPHALSAAAVSCSTGVCTLSATVNPCSDFGVSCATTLSARLHLCVTSQAYAIRHL